MKAKILLPLVVLVGAAVTAAMIVKSKPTVETAPPQVLPPLVRAIEVRKGAHQFRVAAQGTVMPRTESALVAEVSGRVDWVSPAFVNGGFFERGDPLARIAADDYRAVLAQAEANVAAAAYALAREREEADIARREWERLGESSEPSPLVVREPQLADARARLAAAEAARDKALRDLDRTEIRAPYAGRVRAKHVDRGGFASAGMTLAQIYAVDSAEIRLPLPDDELRYVNLPLGYRGDANADDVQPAVELYATFAGTRHRWTGRVVRTEGEIDARTRMVHAVIRVDDPYGHGDDPDRPPLAVGMFVQAEVLGRRVEGVAILPRAALRGNGRVAVIDEDLRLRLREVEILRLTGDRMVVREGVEDGDLICVSTLDAVVDGMAVRVTTEETELHTPPPEQPVPAEVGS